VPIVCALVPSYKVAAARVREPALRERAVLVVDRLERGHVLDLDVRAYALGARRGMTLLQAGSCAREARVTVDEPAHNRALWERALDALDAASPLVEDANEGVAFLEMRGIAGSPQRWIGAALEPLAAVQGDDGAALPFAFGLAVNRFVARAAARVAAGDGIARIVRAGEERAFLAPLALDVLGIDEDTIGRLRLFGIRTLGQLAALPNGPFVRRFGVAAARWHQHARGLDDTPLVPRPRTLRIDRALFGEGSASREDQLLFALRSLVARVADDVAYAGKRCGFLRLHLECENGETRELTTLLAQPTSQQATMFDLLRARLEGVTLQSPVTGLRLGAERLDEGGAELSLFAGDDPDPEIVGIALARLAAALGEGSALRARVVDGNRYETRFRYEPFTADVLARPRSAPRTATPFPERASLTLRLIVPLAIEVVTSEGFPSRVGTPPRTVIDVAGPWRTDEAWWDDVLAAPVSHTVVRDEFDVLLDGGALWRIARDGAAWTLRGTYD
jgi:protein ImuB